MANGNKLIEEAAPGETQTERAARIARNRQAAGLGVKGDIVQKAANVARQTGADVAETEALALEDLQATQAFEETQGRIREDERTQLQASLARARQIAERRQRLARGAAVARFGEGREGPITTTGAPAVEAITRAQQEGRGGVAGVTRGIARQVQTQQARVESEEQAALTELTGAADAGGITAPETRRIRSQAGTLVPFQTQITRAFTPETVTSLLDRGTITKGQASDLLTRLAAGTAKREAIAEKDINKFLGDIFQRFGSNDFLNNVLEDRFRQQGFDVPEGTFIGLRTLQQQRDAVSALKAAAAIKDDEASRLLNQAKFEATERERLRVEADRSAKREIAKLKFDIDRDRADAYVRSVENIINNRSTSSSARMAELSDERADVEIFIDRALEEAKSQQDFDDSLIGIIPQKNRLEVSNLYREELFNVANEADRIAAEIQPSFVDKILGVLPGVNAEERAIERGLKSGESLRLGEPTGTDIERQAIETILQERQQ